MRVFSTCVLLIVVIAVSPWYAEIGIFSDFPVSSDCYLAEAAYDVTRVYNSERGRP